MMQRHDFDPIAFFFGVVFTGLGVLFMIGRVEVLNHAHWVWPGLLVGWRQGEGGWSGRVTYAVAGPQGTVLVEAWVPAALLEQR